MIEIENDKSIWDPDKTFNPELIKFHKGVQKDHPRFTFSLYHFVYEAHRDLASGKKKKARASCEETLKLGRKNLGPPLGSTAIREAFDNLCKQNALPLCGLVLWDFLQAHDSVFYVQKTGASSPGESEALDFTYWHEDDDYSEDGAKLPPELIVGATVKVVHPHFSGDGLYKLTGVDTEARKVEIERVRERLWLDWDDAWVVYPPPWNPNRRV